MKQSDKDRRALEDAREELERLNMFLQDAEMNVARAKEAMLESEETLKLLVDRANAVGQNDDGARIVLARAAINYVRLLL